MAEPRGQGLWPPTVFQGGWGAQIYAFISTILPLRECICNFIGLPSKLKPRKELNSETSSLKFCLWDGGNRN